MVPQVLVGLLYLWGVIVVVVGHLGGPRVYPLHLSLLRPELHHVQQTTGNYSGVVM